MSASEWSASSTDELVDLARWPNQEKPWDVSSEHLAAVQADLSNFMMHHADKVEIAEWIMVRKRSKKFVKRILVVSELRLRLYKLKKPFKTSLVCCKDYRLLTIRSLSVLQSKEQSKSSILVTLATDPEDDSKKKTKLHVDAGEHSEALMKLLQRLLYRCRLTFDFCRPPTLRLPADMEDWRLPYYPSLPLSPTSSASPSRGIHTSHLDDRDWTDAVEAAYKVYCDELQVPFRSSVVKTLQDCLQPVYNPEDEINVDIDFQYCLRLASSLETRENETGPSQSYQTYQEPTLRQKLRQVVANYHLFASSPAAYSLRRALCMTALQLREVQALSRTVQKCRSIHSVIVCDLPIGEAGTKTVLDILVSPSAALQGLVLSNIGLSLKSIKVLQHIVLQSTIRQSDGASFCLRRLDLSYNFMSSTMTYYLSIALETLPNALELLNLEQCSLTSHSSSHILEVLRSNPGFAIALKELNLSGNRLGLKGTRQLGTWLASASVLQKLLLAGTGLDLESFCQSLQRNRNLCNASLSLLDLSYNYMPKPAAEAIGQLFGTSRSLHTLILRGILQKTWLTSFRADKYDPKAGATTGLSKQCMESIFAPMFKNMTRECPCNIDLSENDLRGTKISALAQLIDNTPTTPRACVRLDRTCLHDQASILLLHSLRGCRSVESLSLQGNGYVRVPLASSLEPLQPSSPISSIEKTASDTFTLLLSGAYPVNDNQNDRRVAAHVGSPLSSLKIAPKHLTLKELCLKCDSTSDYVFGPHIITAVAKSLALNTTLQVLDVTGNMCGDKLAVALGDMLPKNTTLQTLLWDMNCISVEGFESMFAGLERNSTLVSVEMPIRDTRRILEDLKNPPRDRLFNVLAQIFRKTEKNHHRCEQDGLIRGSSHFSRKGSEVAKHDCARDVERTDGVAQGQMSINLQESSTWPTDTKTWEEDEFDAMVEFEEDDETFWESPTKRSVVGSTTSYCLSRYSSSRAWNHSFLEDDTSVRASWEHLQALRTNNAGV